MTPEEQVRMNELCVAIQEEKNYERFAAMPPYRGRQLR
jgi:hypothetical protein